MSHFTHIQTKIRDLDALRAACEEMGLGFVQHGFARGYSGNRTAGEVVILLSGPYDLALNRESDGSYGITADRWNGHVEREVGANFGRLLQLYGVHKATREARRKGYRVRRQPLAGGRIKLCIEGV